MMGGFNLPGIDWVQEQGKGRADEDFLVLFQDCFLTQFVAKPTRGSAVPVCAPVRIGTPYPCVS